MILDSLSNAEKYYELHPLFKDAFDYIKSTNFEDASLGKMELKGDDLFAIISDSDMRTQAEAPLEVHNEYIDIQLPVSCTEVFGWKSRAELVQEDEVFDPKRDIQFFKDEYTSLISVAPGNFVVFFPQDGHAPCIGNGTVRKVVIKIRKK